MNGTLLNPLSLPEEARPRGNSLKHTNKSHFFTDNSWLHAGVPEKTVMPEPHSIVASYLAGVPMLFIIEN